MIQVHRTRWIEWDIFPDWRERLRRNFARPSTGRWEPLDAGRLPIEKQYVEECVEMYEMRYDQGYRSVLVSREVTNRPPRLEEYFARFGYDPRPRTTQS